MLIFLLQRRPGFDVGLLQVLQLVLEVVILGLQLALLGLPVAEDDEQKCPLEVSAMSRGKKS